jgi:hypothetical protein
MSQVPAAAGNFNSAQSSTSDRAAVDKPNAPAGQFVSRLCWSIQPIVQEKQNCLQIEVDPFDNIGQEVPV